MGTEGQEVQRAEGRNPIHGYRFEYVPGDRFIGEPMARGEYEVVESVLWTRILRPDSVVLDIGACLGHYAMIAGRLVDPERGRVVAFEPQPDLARLLRGNVQANGFRHVQVVPKAVGAAAGVARIRRNPANWGNHTIYGGDDGAEVAVVSIDDFVAESGLLPTTIKLDVEGYEYFALRGMASVLGGDRPLDLLIEFFPRAAEEARRDLGEGGIAEVWRLLRSSFPEVYLVGDGPDDLVAAEYGEVLDRARRHMLVNLLCRREAGWKTKVEPRAGEEAFTAEFADPVRYRLPVEEPEIDLSDLEIRLIEMGAGRTALPRLHECIGLLVAKGEVTTELLIAEMVSRGEGSIASQVAEAVKFLELHRGPRTRPERGGTPIDWVARGRVPHAAGYGEARWEAVLFGIRHPGFFPYGDKECGLDERVVEYPWVFDRLHRVHPRGEPVLDAGSVMNHRTILAEWESASFGPLTIVTLHPEGESWPSESVRYDYADLRELPYQDSAFATVACISTLEHVGMDNRLYGDDGHRAVGPQAEAKKAICELARVLRPGGTLLLSIPLGRRADHEWLRILNAQEVMDLIDPEIWSESSTRAFRAYADGWREVELREPSEAGYNDPRGRRTAPEWVAAAEAVALLELKKRCESNG